MFPFPAALNAPELMSMRDVYTTLEYLISIRESNTFTFRTQAAINERTTTRQHHSQVEQGDDDDSEGPELMPSGPSGSPTMSVLTPLSSREPSIAPASKSAPSTLSATVTLDVTANKSSEHAVSDATSHPAASKFVPTTLSYTPATATPDATTDKSSEHAVENAPNHPDKEALTRAKSKSTVSRTKTKDASTKKVVTAARAVRATPTITAAPIRELRTRGPKRNGDQAGLDTREDLTEASGSKPGEKKKKRKRYAYVDDNGNQYSSDS